MKKDYELRYGLTMLALIVTNVLWVGYAIRYGWWN